MRRKRQFAAGCLSLFALLLLAVAVRAQGPSSLPKRRLITQSINENSRVTLRGNTRREANALNDRGVVDENFAMEHMMLQLKRSPEQETALQQFITSLQDPKSPSFHQWIGADEFGQRFGLAQEDLDAITRWLQSYGFRVNIVYSNGLVIDFSGSAGQVRQAFHTEIHNLEVQGVKHVANMSDPRIPAALAPAVTGIVSLHDFAPHALHVMHSNYTFSNGSSTQEAVTPTDLATIYNLNPLFNAGISGQGQTIVVVEDTNVYSTADWTTFRSAFGLSGYTSATFTQVQPAPATGSNNCTKPTLNGDDGEAILDAEYASAAAPSATIELISCAGSASTFGGLIAMQNLINGKTAPPAIMSISYGECEAALGAASNAAYSSLFAQAVTEGVSVFAAAGDAGAAGCDEDQPYASHGIGVSGFASTPYNVAVGGTDFGDTYAGTNANYWSSADSSTYGSALSYIPEIPWDDSCASPLVAALNGYSISYGFYGFCNTYEDTTTFAGSGGPSACATGAPDTKGVIGGTCAGYAKPPWQTVLGNPNDGVRDMPDVSLFAATGTWGHYYIFCDSDVEHYGSRCIGSPGGWSGAGGTSFASPIMAGIQSLVNQSTASRQGNPAPTYYALAANEYGSAGSSTCNSTLGNGTASNCIFYDVTLGSNIVNCSEDTDCYDPGGFYGVLSTSSDSYLPAFNATTGWDFATGIGSVNAANLVNNWPNPNAPPPANFTLSAAPSSLTITQGAGGTSTIAVTPQNGFSAAVTFSASGLPAGVTASFAPASSPSSSVLTLTASASAATGTATVTVTGTSASLTNTTTLSLTVNAAPAPTFTLSAAPASVSITQGAAGGTSTITIAPQNGFTGNVALSASGLPNGVTASFNPASATTASTVTLTASATAATGTSTVTVTGISGALTQTTTISLTVSAAASPNFTLGASPASVTLAQGAAGGPSTVTITPQNGFSGNVSLSASGLPSGVTANFNPATTTSTSSLTLTASATAATGTATVTITGISGTLTKTTTLSLTVNPAPSFSLSASPSSVTVTQGGSGGGTISVTPQNGFTGTVSLSASGLPSGVTASFSPASTTSSSAVTLTASTSAATGTGTITITGTSGALVQTATISLTVNASSSSPNFSLTATPNSLAISPGGSGATTTIALIPANGFTGNVSLTLSTLPTGVMASWSAGGGSTINLTLSATSTAPAGTSTVTVTGTSGSLVNSVSVALTVNSSSNGGDYTLSVSPSSISVTRGSNASTTVSVNALSGFSGNVSLSASGLPSGVTASFNPTSTSSTSTLRISASSSAGNSTFNVTITGKSGGLVHTTTLSVTVHR